MFTLQVLFKCSHCKFYSNVYTTSLTQMYMDFNGMIIETTSILQCLHDKDFLTIITATTFIKWYNY